MLGISTITNPVQKPLLQDDLFDAEYSSSEDECNKPELDSHSSRDSTNVVQDNAGAEKCSGATDVEKKATDDEKDAIDDKKDVTNRNNATDDEKNTTEDEKDATDDEKDGTEDANDAIEDVEKNEYEGMEAENSAGSDDDSLARPSPMERAKTKKQKASERQNSSRRVKQKAIEQIHSESQRIIRESKLVIPYHTPKPLSLNEFFSKKPNLTQIKAPQALSRILQSSTMKEKPIEQVRSKHLIHRRAKTTYANSKLSKHTTMKPEDPKLSEPTTMKPEGNSEKLNTDSDIKDTVDDSDEDPDKLVLRLDSLSDDEEMDMKLEETDINLSEKIEETSNEGKNDGLEPPLQAESQDWSLRLDTQSVPNTLPELESPVTEVLCTGSTMESSLTDTPTQQSQDSESDTTVSKMMDSCEDGQDSALTNDVMVTPVNKSLQSESSGSNKKRLLEMLKGYDTMVPKLGGNRDAIINFDSDEVQPSTGVNTLMERFIKHSTKKYVTKKKHVQLEVVKKELNSEGKEELVHELVPVTLGEDEQKDPKLETPGAKLLKLKENLQVKMKVQREIERQRRIDAYRMDNEEGYEENEHKEDELGFNEEEEEAELTDGSETDGDYEPDEAVDNDYDDDDDDDSETEEKNIFLDGQAKEDDMEELSSVEINNKKLIVSETNNDDDSDDEFVFKIRKKKKRTVVEDEDEEDEEKCVETHNSWKNGIVLDKSNHHDDTSTISSSSVKSLFKNPIRYSMAADGKTMDLFDSSTNTTDRSEDTANLSVPDGCNTSIGAFSFTPIKEKTGLIRHKSTDFANTPDSDEDEECKEDNDHSKEVDSRNFPIPSERSVNLNSSFDNSSAIPPYQPTNSIDKSSTNASSHEFQPRSLRQNETVCKMGGLTLPIEDSQDLFQQDFSYPQSASSAEIGNSSQNLHLSFEDNTQTQFLDENGFLKVKTQQASSKSHKLIMPKDDDDEHAGDMNELLGLCSGQFTATLQPSKPSKGVFSQLGNQGTGTPEMDELLQLCSGTFTGKNKHEEVGDDVSESSFQMLSDNESIKSKDADGFSDNEDEKHDKNDNEELGGINEDTDNEEQPTAKKIFKNKFIEEEAELSGSEFGSDEEYDAEEFGDLIAEEMINEDVGNEGDIHNKIQKMHMKLTDDEDARRLRLYKEAFLTDGDLHDGSKGRTRQFRWRNVDDDSWTSGANNNSDDEAEEVENENELEWRKQRHEREQCIKSQDEENKIQDEEDCLDLDENSQFDKFIKKVSVKRRKKSTVTVPETNNTAARKTPTKPKMTLFKHGSFLNRAKNDLERITNMFKPLSNPNRPRNARNFVFQSLSPQKADDTESESQMKRPLSNVDKATPNLPKNKKARLNTSQPKQAKSIFQLL
ncbi:claspin-like isoform X2 [Anneissia japonica]|uniref:claspin-like isoform X2 n=1 Tax=Anneissia japonica TaxID=1529436 RepID=UPI001425A2EA|nr:claspin-like isoform X2 [Anneissia japonica]